MNYLVIGLEGVAPDALFGDEALENIRRLIEFGCYGKIDDASALNPREAWTVLAQGQAGGLPGLTIWDHLAANGVNSALIGVAAEPSELQPQESAGAFAGSQQQFERLRQFLAAGELGYFHIVDRSPAKPADETRNDVSAAYRLHIDGQVGQTLETISEDTVVLIVCVADHQPAGFVLATLGLPLQGEIQGAHLQDLAPTLLELGGMPIPPTMDGKPLVMGGIMRPDASPGLTPEEEEILRERLSGLGYIE